MNNKLKIAQFNRDDIQGGAAKASYRLYRGLKKLDASIDYFVKKSFNSNTKNTPDNNSVNVSNETDSDDAISDYAKVANMRKENKFG